jgi:hypothetical protein
MGDFSILEIVLFILGGSAILFILIKFQIIPEFQKEMEEKQKEKNEKEKQANTEKYKIERARLTKYINQKMLSISEEYQNEFLTHITNQMNNDISFDKTTWTKTNDIDAVVEYFQKKTNFGKESNVDSKYDILSRKREVSKERFQEVRKRRKIQDD